MGKESNSNKEAPAWKPPYGTTMTFSRLPHIENPTKEQADIAFVGIPWDGLVTYKPGTRFGPRDIRQASVACRSYSPNMGIDLYKKLNVVDTGDIPVADFDANETFNLIESKIVELQNKGISTVALGGDHSILLPILRAIHKVHPKFTLIQFDAHTDTSENENHHHGTCVRDAIEEGLIEGNNIFQIGIRGSFGSADYLDFGNKEGIHVLDMHDFHTPEKRYQFFETIKQIAGTEPCYITFDIDSVDPAFAPGTGTPVPGGFSSFEVIDMLRDLRGLKIIGGDVVEVSPPYDNRNQITSLLGATIGLQIASLIGINAIK